MLLGELALPDELVLPGAVEVGDAEPVAFVHDTLDGMVKLSLRVRSAH